MVATINIPGSQYFDYFDGTKAECKAWLEEKERVYQERYGGTWYNAYAPARMTSNSDAKTWRHHDGTRVIKGL